MDLNKAKIICIDLRNHYCLEVPVTFEDMGYYAGGETSWFGKNIKIRMNTNFVTQFNEEEVLDIMLHEIAHALDVQIRGESFHDNTWRTIAKSIGCNGERCYKGKIEAIGKTHYVYTCPNCGKESIKTWKRGPNSKAACGTCCKKYNNGNFTEKYVFQLTRTFINK